MNFLAKNRTMIPATPTLKRSLDALTQASLEVEQGLRDAGRYSRDAKPQSEKRSMAKSGFTILLESDGSASVIPLGDMHAQPRRFTPDEFEAFKTWFSPGPENYQEKSLRIEAVTRNTEAESYEMMAEGEAFKGATQRSHAPSKRGGNFSPIQSEQRNPVGDAAIAMRESQRIAREKQASVSDDMKRHSRAQYQRNADIARQMKEVSAKQWGAK